MSRLCLIFVLACVSRSYGVSMPLAFKDSGIVPDVLTDVPIGFMNVQYPNSVEAYLGNILTPTQVKDVPWVTWDDVVPHVFYTVVFADLDVPSRDKPTYREWLHWLVVNVPGDNITAGDTIAEYIGAGPGKDSGLHRYMFLVYEQPYQMTFDEPRLTNRSMAHRAMFSSRIFAKKHNLGKLFAGNFFQSEWDDYVPILYQQLGAGAAAGSGQRCTLSSTMTVLTSAMILILKLTK